MNLIRAVGPLWLNYRYCDNDHETNNAQKILYLKEVQNSLLEESLNDINSDSDDFDYTDYLEERGESVYYHIGVLTHTTEKQPQPTSISRVVTPESNERNLLWLPTSSSVTNSTA